MAFHTDGPPDIFGIRDSFMKGKYQQSFKGSDTKAHDGSKSSLGFYFVFGEEEEKLFLENMEKEINLILRKVNQQYI